MLGKLQERQNVILGDEMGLGKTIQVRAKCVVKSCCCSCDISICQGLGDE